MTDSSRSPQPARLLPPQPHLGYYRKQAKALLKAFRAGDPAAVQRFRTHLTRVQGASQAPVPTDPAASASPGGLAARERAYRGTLSEAQFVMAREHGFPSWPHFKRHVERVLARGTPSALNQRRPVGDVLAPWPAGFAATNVCLVPGFGILPADDPGLVALEPVSVTHEGVTLTITDLVSSGGETTVRVEIRGLPEDQGRPALAMVSTRDTDGKSTPPVGWRAMFGTPGPDGNRAQRIEAKCAALAPDARTAHLVIDGPPPLQSCSIAVPVVPVAAAGLPMGRPASSLVAHEGITVRAVWIISGAEHTAIQLIGTADPPVRFIRGLGRTHPPERMLRDAQGQEYLEIPSQGHTWPAAGGVYTDDILFPVLPADAGGAAVVLPFVTVEEEAPEATLHVPLAGATIGDRIPIAATLSLGHYMLHVTGAQLVEPFRPGRNPNGEARPPRLMLEVNLGDWHEGRKLVAPGVMRVNGEDRGYQSRLEQTDIPRIWVPLPQRQGKEVAVAFASPKVAVKGPWRLPLE